MSARGLSRSRWRAGGRALLAIALLAGLFGGGAPPWPAAAQGEAVPPVTAPVPLSERLRAQGHAVDPAEAAYLDADEQVTEGFVQPLTVVLAFADAPQRLADWHATATELLRQLLRRDPLQTPVIPPPALQAVHAQAVAYRQHLRAAAEAWLAGLEAGAPDWLQWGAAEYGAAEAARAEWYRALWERYVGEPPPGS